MTLPCKFLGEIVQKGRMKRQSYPATCFQIDSPFCDDRQYCDVIKRHCVSCEVLCRRKLKSATVCEKYCKKYYEHYIVGINNTTLQPITTNPAADGFSTTPTPTNVQDDASDNMKYVLLFLSVVVFVLISVVVYHVYCCIKKRKPGYKPVSLRDPEANPISTGDVDNPAPSTGKRGPEVSTQNQVVIDVTSTRAPSEAESILKRNVASDSQGPPTDDPQRSYPSTTITEQSGASPTHDVRGEPSFPREDFPPVHGPNMLDNEETAVGIEKPKSVIDTYMPGEVISTCTPAPSEAESMLKCNVASDCQGPPTDQRSYPSTTITEQSGASPIHDVRGEPSFPREDFPQVHGPNMLDNEETAEKLEVIIDTCMPGEVTPTRAPSEAESMLKRNASSDSQGPPTDHHKRRYPSTTINEQSGDVSPIHDLRAEPEWSGEGMAQAHRLNLFENEETAATLNADQECRSSLPPTSMEESKFHVECLESTSNGPPTDDNLRSYPSNVSSTIQDDSIVSNNEYEGLMSNCIQYGSEGGDCENLEASDMHVLLNDSSKAASRVARHRSIKEHRTGFGSFTSQFEPSGICGVDSHQNSVDFIEQNSESTVSQSSTDLHQRVPIHDTGGNRVCGVSTHGKDMTLGEGKNVDDGDASLGSSSGICSRRNEPHSKVQFSTNPNMELCDEANEIPRSVFLTSCYSAESLDTNAIEMQSLPADDSGSNKTNDNASQTQLYSEDPFALNAPGTNVAHGRIKGNGDEDPDPVH